MNTVSNELWSLMAKCITHEASANERLVMDNLLLESDELLNTFNELQRCYQTKEQPLVTDPAPAFEKLNERIKKMTKL